MKVEIEGAVMAKDIWWGVNFVIELDDTKSPTEKIAMLKKTIDRIAASGHVVTRMTKSGSPSLVAGQQKNSPPKPGNGGSPAFTWAPPTCEIHREDMAISKQQNKQGRVAYYCSKRIGDGYCTKRCTVDEKTGKPSFWEVKV